MLLVHRYSFTVILSGLSLGLLNFGDKVGRIAAGMFTLVGQSEVVCAFTQCSILLPFDSYGGNALCANNISCPSLCLLYQSCTDIRQTFSRTVESCGNKETRKRAIR